MHRYGKDSRVPVGLTSRVGWAESNWKVGRSRSFGCNGCNYVGVGFNVFLMFTPTFGDDPIWRAYCFQRGWFNHHLEKVVNIYLGCADREKGISIFPTKWRATEQQGEGSAAASYSIPPGKAWWSNATPTSLGLSWHLTFRHHMGVVHLND